MLDSSALSQLSQLKSDIQASKDYAEGTISATGGRFGFVRTDDGRDAYLAPEKMDRVLAGDRVKISIVTNDQGKLEANLEAYFSSEISKFVGQYRIKGKGHFVVPLGGKFNRWIFVPPKQRKGAKDGDYVVAKMSKHPYKDGKAQANVLFRVGAPDDAFIEHKFVKAKYELNYRSEDKVKAQSEDIAKTVETLSDENRINLCDKDFVTIDSASTLDMDDALSVEKTDEGFVLFVAIADPGSFIQNGSPLAQQAQKAGQSVYLLGGAVPMLPSHLAHHTFSLEEEKVRPALVCEIHIAADGKITTFSFKRALIRSKHKLSYEQVADFLENENNSVPADIEANLRLLKTMSDARRQERNTNSLVSDDHADYDYSLNQRGHIENIVARPRNLAQQIVEESMIATNICAGKYLAENKLGLHSTHKGFREDRLGEVKALLKEEEIPADDINDYSQHIALMKTLASSEKLSVLIPPLRRMMQAAEMSTTPSAHLGLGLENYAPITSPIRRFTDLHNHWCIISSLSEDQTAPPFNETNVNALNETNRNGRQADRELQQWLSCIYTQNLLNTVAKGQIRIVTQQGFGVKLIKNGIEGFVLFDKKTEKNFDAKRMTLTVNDRVFRIGDEVEITIKSVDMDKRRIAFELGPVNTNLMSS